MEIAYTLTKDDLAAFYRFHARHRAKRRWAASLSTGIIVGLWTLLLLFLAQAVFNGGWATALQNSKPSLLSFGLLSLYLIYLFWGQRRLIASYAAQGDLLDLPTRLHAAPEGLRGTTRYEQTMRAWSEFVDVGSDSTALYLYLTAASALIVPHRAFPNAADTQQFEAQARQWQAEAALYPHTEAAEADEDVWPPRPKSDIYSSNFTLLPQEGEDTPGALTKTYTISKKDLARLLWFLMPRRPMIWVGGLLSQFLIMSALLVFSLPVAEALLAGAAGAILITLLALNTWVQQAVAASAKKYPQGGRCRMVASPGALGVAGTRTITRRSWANISGVYVRRGNIYVLIRGFAGAEMVPKATFANAQVAREFAQTLRIFWQAGKDALPAQDFIPSGLS